MVSYDPSVIQEFASRLYSKADWIVFRETALGIVCGLLAALFGNVMIQPVLRAVSPFGRSDSSGVVLIILIVAATLLGGALGWMIGDSKAFHLRLKAQLALCQVQIELNTRTGR